MMIVLNRLVQSPSRHRYFGQNPDNAVSDVTESSQAKSGASERDVSLAVPDSPLLLDPLVCTGSGSGAGSTMYPTVSLEEPPPVVNPISPERLNQSLKHFESGSFRVIIFLFFCQMPNLDIVNEQRMSV